MKKSASILAVAVLCGLAGSALGASSRARNAPTKDSTTIGAGDPRGSFLYENFVLASEVLDRAIAAHGGAVLIDRSGNFRFSFTGTLRYQGHYPRPWAHLDYRMEGTTVYTADRRAVKSEQTFTEGGKSLPYFTIVGPANGLKLDAGSSKAEPIPEADLGKAMQEELELLPQEYLRQARAGAAGLRFLSGARGYEVVSYTLDNGEGRALFFDPRTHLLMRVERIGHWKHKGDRLEWRTFDNYVYRNGIKIPLHSESHVENSSTQQGSMTDIGALQIGGEASAEDLAIPASRREGLESWKLEERKDENPLEPLPSADLGKGVYIISLPPSDARSLLVAFADFSVIVEAGDYSEISARLLATADRLAPGKPVRYVAMTHHHPLYANGLRPYAQRGVTILATAGDVAYYRDLTTRPYRIHPDEQQRTPREPRFLTIHGTYTIEDGSQRLELYEYDYTTHVDEFVLPYLPSHKLIVTADQVYILRDEKVGPASARERAIARVVKERKLDVQNIMQTWFLTRSDHQVPYSILEEKVRLADAKK